MLLVYSLFLSLVGGSLVSRAPGPLENCPGYEASHVSENAHGLTADLHLAGKSCNTYGYDLNQLKLTVEYDTG